MRHRRLRFECAGCEFSGFLANKEIPREVRLETYNILKYLWNGEKELLDVFTQLDGELNLYSFESDSYSYKTTRATTWLSIEHDLVFGALNHVVPVFGNSGVERVNAINRTKERFETGEVIDRHEH